MELKELLVKELEKEAVSTRKILQVVPDGKNDWQPHEKSFALGRLATHVAELPAWINRVLDNAEYDMAAQPMQRLICDDNAELLSFFEEKLSAAISALQNTSNEILMSEWTFRRGDHIITQSSRYEAIRSWMYNHQVHHRGQLSVYLRLLDVPIPGMYGPSADNRLLMEQAQKN